jgi:hypothetical protein
MSSSSATRWLFRSIPTAVLLLATAGCASPDYFVACAEERDSTGLPAVDTEFLTAFDPEASADGDRNHLCGSRRDDVFDNRFSPYLGGADSVDLIVEHFSNLRCPHCADFAAYSRALWQENPEIADRVRIYFHHLPSPGNEPFHAAAIAAGNEGMTRFFEMHDFIYSRIQVPLLFQDVRDYAQSGMGLDMAAFDEATMGGNPGGDATYALIDRDLAAAADACATSTPSVYVCGRLLYDWRDLEAVIRQYLDE